MYFDLKKTEIYRNLKWNFSFKLIKVLKIFILLFFLLSVYLYGSSLSDFWLGFSLISFILFINSLLKESFFNAKIKKPKIKNPDNLAEFLSFESALAVKKSFKFLLSWEIDSTHIFYFLLEDNPKFDFVFSRALLNIKEIKKELRRHLNEKRHNLSSVLPESLSEIVLRALKIAQEKNHKRIEAGDMLIALAQCDPIFSGILINNGLDAEDIENLVYWLEDIEERIEKRKRFWDYENLAGKGTLAKQWSAGYTINLDQYALDLTDIIKRKNLEFVGHKQEIELMERILSRREINNVLVVGQPGTGKKSMILALAKKSLLGSTLSSVDYKRVMELDMSSLLAKVKGIDEAEEVLDSVFSEAASAGNIILVIDKFHNYINQSAKPGVIDISGIIAPYLKLPQFQLIAITDYEGLHRNIERNPSILSMFEKVEVSEISPRETLILLEGLVSVLEKKYKRMISYSAIKEVVSLSERYMPSLAFPEKAIEILDEVVIYAATSTKDRIVLPRHVAKVIREKTEIPVGEIEAKEREVLLNLEDLIHQRIINQEEAVKEVSTAMRRARSDITIRKGPMGAFLFLGPTGVGKTETSKALAEVYFGSEERMIRLDMSEFQDIGDISRLIGSTQEDGLLTVPVSENPFSIVLLDEIEKAHPSILNLFLQVLDEGHLTDGLGRKVSFKNTIIICTSNAGYEVILKVLKELTGASPFLAKEPVGKSLEVWSKVKSRLIDYLFEKGIFRPEFINRFDAFVVFSPLSKKNLLDIAGLMFSKLKKNLKEKGIDFIATDSLKEKIVELSYSPVFGAREMRRVIQEKVENVLAEALLKNEIRRGNKVEMTPDFKLIIN